MGSVVAGGDASAPTYIGCGVEGCVDPEACNYNPDATISTDCTYPEGDYDCEGVFVCSGIAFTLDMYDSFGDGWNGNSFTVVDYYTDEVVAGPYTIESGDFGTTQACFPADMAWGCYLINVDGDEASAAEVTWHLYGFEVFGSYVVDYSAGVLQWNGMELVVILSMEIQMLSLI